VLTGQDDAIYVALARSLRQGGYRDLFLIDAPVHSQYPPGYPALLAVAEAAFGEHTVAYLLPGLLASALTLFLVWRTLVTVWEPGSALAVLAVLAVNPYLVQYAGQIRAEGPFMLFCMIPLVLLARSPASRRSMVVAGATALLAALTRSAGVMLVGAIGVYWLLKRKFAAAASLAAASALTVGAWLVWTAMAPDKVVGRSYISDALVQRVTPVPVWLEPVVRARTAFRYYVPVGIPYTLPVPTVSGTSVDNALGALVVTVGLLVGLGLLWRKWRVAALFAMAYGVLLALWPWTSGRFLVPLLPLIVPTFLVGWGALVGRFRPRWRSPAVLLFAAMLFLNGAWRTAAVVTSWGDCDRSVFPFPPSPGCLAPDQVSYFNALAFVRDSLPEDARLLVAKREPLWYYTGRRTVFIPNALRTSAEGFLPFLRSREAEWILLGSLQAREPTDLADRMTANCSRLRLVKEFPPRTYLFQIQADPPDPPAGVSACRALELYREATKGVRFN
jgi:4-amino-4-deoxy-L-arabinose transferase-like glycosyltransferase